jgi:lactate dehydrogenase-like 2-hydroxyacid dehydrogenase
MKPKILITRRIPDAGLDPLREVCEIQQWNDDEPIPRAALLRDVVDVAGLYCLLTEQIDAEVLDAATRLKVVSNMAVGYDNIDVGECTRRKIPVGNTPGVLTETTADLTWALMMAAARRIPEAADHVRAGRWRTWGPMLLTGPDLHHATLGILGMGRIGRAVARRARGFEMRVLYHNRSRDEEAERELGATYVDFDTLLAESDFLSIHAALTPKTQHLIDAEALRKMKPTAVLVNAARGAIIDTQALVDALRDGRLFAVALDVTDPEPLPAEHPLLSFPNCLVVPHIGSASIATRAKMASMAAENLLAGLRGERLPHVVNPSVYEDWA